MMAAVETSDQIMGGLWVLGFLLVGLAVYAKDRRRAPFVPCRRCGGRGRRSWFRGDAWGTCPACGGKPRSRRL